jgi:hypothetical protein
MSSLSLHMHLINASLIIRPLETLVSLGPAARGCQPA